jgi:hypothetical protein
LEGSLDSLDSLHSFTFSRMNSFFFLLHLSSVMTESGICSLQPTPPDVTQTQLFIVPYFCGFL